MKSFEKNISKMSIDIHTLLKCHSVGGTFSSCQKFLISFLSAAELRCIVRLLLGPDPDQGGSGARAASPAEKPFVFQEQAARSRERFILLGYFLLYMTSAEIAGKGSQI